MAFSRAIVDDVLEAIFDDDFGLSDEDESDFDNGDGDDIHALLGEPVLRHADVIPSHVNEENSSDARDDLASEQEHVNDTDFGMPDVFTEFEGFSGASSLDDINREGPHTNGEDVENISGEERRQNVLDTEIAVRNSTTHHIHTLHAMCISTCAYTAVQYKRCKLFCKL